MPTFAELAVSNTVDVGVVWMLEASDDRFDTIAYRWSTAPGKLDGTNMFDARILEMGAISKGLGTDHIAGAATVDVKLDNSDQALDFFTDRDGFETSGISLWFRVTIGLYDLTAPGTIVTKRLGIYSCLDNPVMDPATVTLSLCDDSIDWLSELATPPTLTDWRDAPSSDMPGGLLENSPNGSIGNQVAQLHWGEEFFPGCPAGSQPSDSTATLVVCATRDDNGARANDIVSILFKNPFVNETNLGQTLNGIPSGAYASVPNEIAFPSALGPGLVGATETIWEAKRSVTITKDGVDWRIVWVKFYLGPLAEYLNTVEGWHLQPPRVTALCEEWRNIKIVVHGLGSAVVNAAVTTRVARSPTEVLSDLITQYSRSAVAVADPDALVDGPSFADALSALASVGAAGTVIPWGEASGAFEVDPGTPNNAVTVRLGDTFAGRLKTTLRAVCESFDLDLFQTWDGAFALAMQSYNYSSQTDALVTLDERLFAEDSVNVRIPSPGDRWAHYNRVFVKRHQGLFVQGYAAIQGPFDHPTNIGAWNKKVVPKTLEGAWRFGFFEGPWTSIGFGFNTDDGGTFGGIWNVRAIESAIRPILRFTTDFQALQLDVADYFKTSWTRGGLAGPYVDAIFRVESMRIDPATNTVEVEAVWMDDLRDSNPYLLDDDTYVVVATGSGARTATVEDGDTTVTFSSGNLVSNGVVTGDHLVLLDDTQDTDVFTRYRAVLINSVTDATHLELFGSEDLDFGALTPTAVSNWEIRRSAVTYPDNASDPGNYAVGDDALYGKVAVDGEYSDNTPANQLLVG